MSVWVVAALVLLLNLPFGYWRANVRRGTLQWLLAIHLVVPFVIALRLIAHIGWSWATLPVFVAAFGLGQLLGGRYHAWRKGTGRGPITSCMVWDVVRQLRRSENKRPGGAL